MAWIFSLSAECGTDKSRADAFAAFFDGFTVTDHREVSHKCLLRTYDDDGWWTMVSPEGVSTSGVNCEEDRLQMNAMAQQFYSALRSAPEFRYALVGVEVDSFRSATELDEDLASSPHFKGLVISEAIWSHLGRPAIFHPFRSGFYWREFERAI